jgi:hypothetical protein
MLGVRFEFSVTNKTNEFYFLKGYKVRWLQPVVLQWESLRAVNSKSEICFAGLLITSYTIAYLQRFVQHLTLFLVSAMLHENSVSKQVI